MNINLGEIYEYMGYGANTPAENISELVGVIISEIASVAEPFFGYRICDGRVTGVKTLIVEQTEFNTGSVITRYLKDSEQFIIVVATAGAGVDELIHKYHDSGDILREYVADAIGSALAEAVILYAKEDIESKLRRVSNSYSPGYCGWHVEEQQKLFSLLPDGFCGVKLSESSLMKPIKSVSAILGQGSKVEKKPYGCDICEKKDCFKRKLTK